MLKFGLSIAFSDIDHYCPLAQAAEESGFHAVTLADHLIYPQTFSLPYPYTPDGVPRFGETDLFPDPWIAISAMAALTQRLNFYTNVFVLPTRNPAHVAKTLGTVGAFFPGRFALGIGMGWMPEEFALAGESFAARGRRADEMLLVIEKLWSGEMVSHKGEFYQFEPVRMLPAPTQRVPVYVGGFSTPALRRAARHDGWIADLHTLAELEALCVTVDEYRAEAGRLDQPFEKLAFGCIDAVGADGFRAMEDMGITVATTMPALVYGLGFDATLEQKIDAMKRFADEVIGKM